MKLFITGIGTDVGKTIAAAIVTQALEADYWKPIQAGDLDNSDTHKVQRYVSNAKTVFHPNSYSLNTPASPHYAAALDGVTITPENIIEPVTANEHLVIEGAGGIYVPINDTQTIADLIKPDYKAIIVLRHYLGSINHTLLTVEALKNRGLDIAGIIFNGSNKASEDIILKMTSLNVIGHIEDEPYFDANVIAEYAEGFREKLFQI
jgi:dethiobiotin synthetase